VCDSGGAPALLIGPANRVRKSELFTAHGAFALKGKDQRFPALRFAVERSSQDQVTPEFGK
jgi:hypothetical protein